MKSSSELFPVTLARAEHLAGFTDDVYLIKHNLDQDRTVEIAVTHLSSGTYEISPARDGRHPPVVLLHGAYNNRTLWLQHNGEGLAAWLVRQGFDVWVMEMRGHGYSPRNLDYKLNTVEQYALYDIPAVHAFVREKSGEYPSWVGHSLGGVTLSTAIAAGKLTAENCPGVMTFGAQVLKRPWYVWMPMGGTAARIMMSRKQELDGRKAGIGPENEPVGIKKEMLARQTLFGKWQLHEQKEPLLPGWKAAQLPVFMLMGAADEIDPVKYCQRFFDHYGEDHGNAVEKRAQVLGTATGFTIDYNHQEMIRSEYASKEIWPLVESWLDERAILK